MRPTRTSSFLFLMLVVVMTLSLVLPAPALAAAPTISAKVAVPSMISLFGDIAPGGGDDSPLGPGWTTLVVDGPIATDTVTADLETFFLALLPTDISTRILPAQTTAWDDFLTGLQTTAMTWDGGGSIWKKTIQLDEMFGSLGVFVGTGNAFYLVLEDLRLGAKTVPVTATRGVDSATDSISLTVVDAQIPLRTGWNAGSVPFALASNQWGTVRQYGPGVSFDVAVRWDAAAATPAWVTLGDTYNLKPLEAFFIHATANTRIGAILSRTYSGPPTRSLSAGWNLVGSAPDFTKNWSVSYPKTGTGAKMQGLMKADSNFISLLTTSSGATGYTMVLSLGQDVSYTESHKYGTYSLGTSYPWLFGQPAWGYTTLDSGSILADPGTPANYFGWVVPFGAYWVFMENSDILAGFTSTPVSKEWLAKARFQALGF